MRPSAGRSFGGRHRPARPDDPVRRGVSIHSQAPLEYWIARPSRATTSESVVPTPSAVIASVAKQSILPRKGRMDCFVAKPPRNRYRRKSGQAFVIAKAGIVGLGVTYTPTADVPLGQSGGFPGSCASCSVNRVYWETTKGDLGAVIGPINLSLISKQGDMLVNEYGKWSDKFVGNTGRPAGVRSERFARCR